MRKSDYANRFNISLNYVSREAFIRFVNETPIYNEKYEQIGVEQNEIANIILTEHNLREMHELLGKLLQQMVEWQTAKSE